MSDLADGRFECDCHDHMLVASVAGIDEVADGWKWIELAWWQAGHGRSPWRYRLRHIWRIIRRGEPCGDYLSFEPAEARKLRDWLSEAILQAEGVQVLSTATNQWVNLP